MPKLESFGAYGDLDRRFIAEIIKAPKLTSLTISGPQRFRDSDLEEVWKKKALTRIDLFDETKIGQLSLRRLAQMPRLTHLALSHLDSSDLSTVAAIVRTRRLTEVSFRQCPISNELLSALAGSSTITELNFKECKDLNDGAIQTLKRMKNVDVLRFMSCPNVSRSGASKLATSLHGHYQLD